MSDANERPDALTIQGVSKSFHDPNHPAVDDLSLRIAPGETVALLGPSGCGKTTLLRLVAGFEAPDAGRVAVAGRTVSDATTFTPPEARRIGFVFQDYALFPHLDVQQNVAFGLTGLSRRERRERAREVMDLVGLTVFARRYPAQLSGGQQQRVALARALAPGPDLVLLDEPFSNLDAALREGTRQEVRRILARSGATTLLVTHDQEEAMAFADRLVVMRAGRLEQEGDPEATYRRPRTAFVAGFLGRTNLVRGTAANGRVTTALGTVPLDADAEGQVLVSLRPEDLALTRRTEDAREGATDDAPEDAAEDAEAGLPVVITERQYYGHDRMLRCCVQGGDPDGEGWFVRMGPGSDLRPGDPAWLRAVGAAVALEGSSR